MFTELTTEEKEGIYRLPVYLTLLSISHPGKLEPREREVAQKLAHTRTFSSHPDLHNYYREVESRFQANIDAIEALLPSTKEEKEAWTMERVKHAEKALEKIKDHLLQFRLAKSIYSFPDHLPNMDDRLWEKFVLPVFMGYLERYKKKSVAG